MFALACALLLVADAPAPTAPNPPQSAFGTTEKLRVVVMNLKLAGTSSDYGAAVDGIITESLDQIGPFRAIGQRDIGHMLDFEGEKQKLGCSDGVSCLSEVAGAFGAEYVVTGTLTNADGVYLLQLSLLDIGKATV